MSGLRFLIPLAVLNLAVTAGAAFGVEERAQQLAAGLQPFVAVCSGNQSEFSLVATVEVPIDGDVQRVEATLSRSSDAAFDLVVTHADYAVQVRRRDNTTAFALPKHQVVFIGHGEVSQEDQLSPAGIVERLIRSGSEVANYLPMISQGDSSALASLLIGLLKVHYQPETNRWRVHDSFSFSIDAQTKSLEVVAGDTRVALSIDEPTDLAAVDDWPGFEIVMLPRHELEQSLARGVRRAMEVLAPSALLKSPAQRDRKVAGGELRWIEGHRVVLLQGSPEQIGRAHGELLKSEAHRCVDSVLHMFGTVQTIRSGRWFRHELEAAHARLDPHIPEDHKLETRAMAKSIGIDLHVAELVNVFPELFHCSGFALFGNATRDGKLYHGRVLDYMTTIGLQDAAATFIIAPHGKIAFANVGYAGFTGSVSGMNAQAISLGEMGGRGEGQWDGVPMATLMRRALEECSTLDEVIDLWTRSPRTCEYYYVFADGKTNQAVGVSAVPDSIEFIHPGQSHALLGAGIEDAVVLSAGDRLDKLRERVMERHGAIDVSAAQWLMSRPVAMESNLHNVLFVPEDGVLYVANANHQHPAAERPYVKLHLHELLGSIQREDAAVKTKPGDIDSISGKAFKPADSLNIAEDESADAR